MAAALRYGRERALLGRSPLTSNPHHHGADSGSGSAVDHRLRGEDEAACSGRGLGQIISRQPVVAGCDAPEVLQPVERAFDGQRAGVCAGRKRANRQEIT
jgi:hypothetical protein